MNPASHAAASGSAPAPDSPLKDRARAFAEALIARETFESGEGMLDHCDAVADILASIGADDVMQAASYLTYASQHLNRPEDVIGKAFGPSLARLAVETARLERLQVRSRANLDGLSSPEHVHQQAEAVRKMLLAFSRDLRVVLVRLTSRLQTLRYMTAQRKTIPPSVLRESQEVFAPLANRLGVWQIKWEMEDLLFRAEEPDTYRLVASMLDERRVEREAALAERRETIEAGLRARGIDARVSGRPKHIYSIARKMRGKGLDFNQVFDVRALRVIVPSVADCYAALSWVHEHYTPLPGEFDDYIARPKVNGYQSLHTVVRDAAERAWEIQIRTREMHEHAEHGVAAHWAYKEAGTRGYAGVTAGSDYDAKIAVVRQLLAWERDFSDTQSTHEGLFSDRIYVLTPEAAVIELPAGATPVDFAYTVHTDLGHRCRGARVEGALVPLNTPLGNGQTVHIVSAKEGGPSLDWLNPELGFLTSSRAKSKVRAWFNAQHTRETIARGREMVEKLLQREGKTSVSLEQLATELGFKTPDALFETIGKDELSLRSVESALKPRVPVAELDVVPVRKAQTGPTRGDVLVVGLDSLLTQMARCCKPAPPDAIAGYVTRGRGVSVHRRECASFRELQAREPERVIAVDWGKPAAGQAQVYPVDVMIESSDRPGLLRDISDVFAREQMNVIGVQTQSVRGWASMTFTVEISDTARLAMVLRRMSEVPGVRAARRS